MANSAFSVLKLFDDGSELRSSKMYIDSRSVLDHTNTNPHSYTVNIPSDVNNIVRVRLRSMHMNISALYTVVRASGWRTAGTDQDDVVAHIATYGSLVGARTNVGVNYNVAPITIYNTPQTVQLQVQDMFTITKTSDDNVDERDYTVCLCTGKMEASILELSSEAFFWSDPDATEYAQPMALNLVASDTAPSPSSWRYNNSSLFISTVESELVLKLSIGDTPLRRITSPRTAFEAWHSFRVYRPNDIIAYRDPSNESAPVVTYQCRRDHFSLIFTDQISENWDLIPGSQVADSSIEGAFHVVIPEDTSLHTYDRTFGKEDVVYDTAQGISGGSLSVDWITRTGSSVLFPSYATMSILSLDTAPFARGRRVFFHHTMMLDFEYYTKSPPTEQR